MLNSVSAKIKIAAVLILTSMVFGAGYKVAQLQYKAVISDMNAKLSEARAVSVEEGLKRHAIADALNAEKTKAREVVYKTITKEVDRYVQDPNAGRCKLPDDWVRIHNSAATSASTGLADDSTGATGND